MSGTLQQCGVLGEDDLTQLPGVPGEARLQSGPVAVIECAQAIACNPCEGACPQKSISIGLPITNIPTLNEATCSGCGLCIPACPGLGIFVVDMTHSPDLALVQIPFEFEPLPKSKDEVWGLNRRGQRVCRARVLKVINAKKFDHTAVISIAVPKDKAMEVRAISTLD